MMSLLTRVRCRFFTLSATSNILCPAVLGLVSSSFTQHCCLSSDQRPKKPLSNYLLFCKEKRPQIITDHPELTFPEVGKRLGDAWKSLPDNEKQMYTIRAKEMLEEYQLQLKEFESSFSDFELDEMKEARRKKRQARETRKVKAELKRFEKPKRPVSPFGLFLLEHIVKGESIATQTTRISELWNKTSDEMKMPYKERSKELSENYQIDLAAWKERMIALGREDLIQQKRAKTKKNKESTKWNEEEEEF